jgi:multiple sugar transport system permease protein
MDSLDGHGRLTSSFFERNFFGIILVPLIAMVSITLLYPLLYALYTSFYKWNLFAAYLGKRFIGLAQYKKVFLDPAVTGAFLNTLLYMVLILPLQMVLGTWIAVLLEGLKKGRAFFQTIFLIPVVLPAVGVGIIFKIFLNTDMGLLPFFLKQLGFANFALLSDPFLAKLCIVGVHVWEATPSVAILVGAALRSLDRAPFESAIIDGANGWQVFRFITFPLIKPVIAVILLIGAMDVFRIFDVIFMLTGGGPSGSTESLFTYVVKYFSSFGEVGYSSAQAFVILAFIILMTVFISRALRPEEGTE